MRIACQPALDGPDAGGRAFAHAHRSEGISALGGRVRIARRSWAFRAWAMDGQRVRSDASAAGQPGVQRGATEQNARTLLHERDTAGAHERVDAVRAAGQVLGRLRDADPRLGRVIAGASSSATRAATASTNSEGSPARSEARGSGRAPAGGEWAAFARGRLFARPQSGPAIEALVYRERPLRRCWRRPRRARDVGPRRRGVAGGRGGRDAATAVNGYGASADGART